MDSIDALVLAFAAERPQGTGVEARIMAVSMVAKEMTETGPNMHAGQDAACEQNTGKNVRKEQGKATGATRLGKRGAAAATCAGSERRQQDGDRHQRLTSTSRGARKPGNLKMARRRAKLPQYCDGSDAEDLAWLREHLGHWDRLVAQ